MGWFASVGELHEYELPEIGGWVRLRKELSIGEERAMFANAIKGTVPLDNGQMRIEYDQAKLSFGQVVAYLADWSDKQEISHSAIEALKPEIYNVIEATVQKHVEALGKKPKGRKTKNGDAPTSLSAA